MKSSKIPGVDRQKEWFQRIVSAIFAVSRTCGLYPCQWVPFRAVGSRRIWPPYFIITALCVPIIFTANTVAVRELMQSFANFSNFQNSVRKSLLLIETLEPWIFTATMFIRRRALVRSLRLICHFLGDSSRRCSRKPTCHSLLFGPCITFAALICLLYLQNNRPSNRTFWEKLSLIWVKWLVPLAHESQYSTMCLLYENSFRFFNERIVLLEKTQASDPGLKGLMELSRVHTDLSNGVTFLNEYFSSTLFISALRVRVNLMLDLYRCLAGFSSDIIVQVVLYGWRFFLLCHRGQQLSTEWKQLIRQVKVRTICIDLNGMYNLNYKLLLSTTATTLTYLITNMQLSGKAKNTGNHHS